MSNQNNKLESLLIEEDLISELKKMNPRLLDYFSLNPYIVK